MMWKIDQNIKFKFSFVECFLVCKLPFVISDKILHKIWSKITKTWEKMQLTMVLRNGIIRMYKTE